MHISNSKLASIALLVLVIAASTLFAVNRLAEPETFLMLKTGGYILQTHTVPTHDIFSYSAAGAPWVAHFWLTAVLFYLVYGLGSAGSLILVVALFALTTFIFLFATVRLRTFSIILPLVIAVPLLTLTSPLWSARPQIVTYLFSVLLIYLLERARVRGHYAPLWVLPVLFLFWANSHAGVILGLLILWLFAGASLWRSRHTLVSRQPLQILAIATLSTLAVLVNPNGHLILSFSFSFSSVANTLAFTEWFSLLERLQTWQAKVFLTLMVSSALFFIRQTCIRYRRSGSFDLFDIGLFAGAFVLPLLAVRHTILFPLLALPIMSVELSRFVNEKYGPDFIDRLEIKWRNAFLVLGCALVIFAGFTAYRTLKDGLFDRQRLGMGAVDFIQNQNIKGPLFNNENGDYLVWRLWPQEMVFIDGRNDVYRGKPLDEFLTIFLGRPGWQNLVDDRYKINYFILWYGEDAAYRQNLNLAERLFREDNFKAVYRDANSLVLLRNTAENQAVVKKFAVPLF